MLTFDLSTFHPPQAASALELSALCLTAMSCAVAYEALALARPAPTNAGSPVLTRVLLLDCAFVAVRAVLAFATMRLAMWWSVLLLFGALGAAIGHAIVLRRRNHNHSAMTGQRRVVYYVDDA